MKIASLQIGIKDGQTKEERIDYVLGKMEESRDADLLLLPELWNVGFFSFDQYDAFSESLDGPTMQAISAKAKEIGSYVFAGSFVEKKGSDLLNTSVLVGPDGKIKGDYNKIHLFGYGSRESELLKAGERVVVVDTEIGKLGLSTCYDLRFPELYRKMMEMGAEVFLVTSGWPFPRVEHWKVLNQARAIENVCWLVSCNCAGADKGVPFLGHSMIVDPWGVVVAGSTHEERTVRADIDVQMVHDVRKVFPAIQDRVAL